MCLANLFASATLCRRFAIATVNFHLRGEESDGDRELVRQWAGERGIEFFTTDFDTEDYARRNGISIEMAARELRYGWFAEIMEKHGFDRLATAHHLGDSAETMILNLLRGTGLRGMGGIRADGGRVIRPLAGFTRSEIERYAHDNAVVFREDSTNRESEFARNRIRNEVFPHFEKINPSFLRTFEKDMEHFREAGDILDEQRESVRKRLCVTPPEGCEMALSLSALDAQPHCRWYLREILEPYGFNADMVEDMLGRRDAVSGRKFISRDWMLVSDRNELRLYRNCPPTAAQIIVEVFDRPPRFSLIPPEGTLYVDADKVNLPLQTRLWRDGDRFQPFGMKGSRLVSDFLKDIRLDSFLKERQTVATTVIRGVEMIVCIPPHRIDGRFRIGPTTERIASIRIADKEI